MKKTEVTIPWTHGLHLTPAAKLVRVAQRFRSQIRFQLAGRIADARSILSILLLAATCSAPLTIVAEGDDETEAIATMESFFAPEAGGEDIMGESGNAG